MSNDHFQLSKYLAQEKEISIEEARKILKLRRGSTWINIDFLELFKNRNKEVNNNERIDSRTGRPD